MKLNLLVGIMALFILMFPTSATFNCPAGWNNEYDVILPNDGSTRVNELVFINLTYVTFNNANRSDLIWQVNGTTIPYQFMMGQNSTVIRANLSNATNYGYYICTNNSTISTWQNTTFIDVYNLGTFENGDGYINSTSVSGIGGWVTKNCNTGSAITTSKVNTTVKFRDSSSLSMPVNAMVMNYNANTSGTVVYETAYMAKSAQAASTSIFNYYNYSGSGTFHTRNDLTYNDLNISFGGSSLSNNGTQTPGGWIAINNMLVSNANSNSTSYNSTMGVGNWYNKAKSTSMANFNIATRYLCLQSPGASGWSYWDNIFFATTQITQYTNFTDPFITGIQYYSAPGGDTCTYSGTGNYAVTCSDNCTWSSNVNLATKNVTITGSGFCQGLKYLKNATRITISGGCRVRA